MKIGIIGGGAAGIACAITAYDNNADVTIIEAGDRILKKVLLTGNGRCNFTNLKYDSSMYNIESRPFIEKKIKEFSPEKTIRFFNNLGLLEKSKDGYVYPLSNSSSSVVDCLRFALSDRKINIVLNEKVEGISLEKNIYTVLCFGKKYNFDKLVICTGGVTYKKTGSDGSMFDILEKMKIKVRKPIPALCPIKVKENDLKSISGVRADGKVSLFIDGEYVKSEIGEIQFTDSYVSGIPVFCLTNLANRALYENRKVSLEIDVLINYKSIELIKERSLPDCERTIEEYLSGTVNRKLIDFVIKRNGISSQDKYSSLGEKERIKLMNSFKSIRFTAVYNDFYDTAQVTSGGVMFSEVNDELMSKKYNGLYFAGEVLDCDGICGGYNLNFAFHSGILTAKAAVGVK